MKFLTDRKAHVSLTKTTRLMKFREIQSRDNHMKHINELYAKIQNILMLKVFTHSY